MATYKVISDNFTLAPKGATVPDTDLVGLNIDALVEGGHLEATKQSKNPEKTEE